MKIIDPPISHCVEIIDYIRILNKEGKVVNFQDLVAFFCKTPAYTKKGVDFLVEFKLVTEGSGLYSLDDSVVSYIDGSKEKTLLLIKERVIKFKPFLEFHYFKSIGKSSLDSAKLVKKIYDLTPQVSHIIKTFDSWERQFNLKTNTATLLDEGEFEKLHLKINDEVLALKFIKEQFGSNFKLLNDKVVNDFVKALTTYVKDPASAVNDMGRGLEDFLRVDYANTVDLSSCTGLGQIAAELNKFAISHKKHNIVLQGLAAIRTMGDAHGVDRLSGERWVVNTFSSLLYIHSVITLINSVLVFKTEGKLVY